MISFQKNQVMISSVAVSFLYQQRKMIALQKISSATAIATVLLCTIQPTQAMWLFGPRKSKSKTFHEKCTRESNNTSTGKCMCIECVKTDAEQYLRKEKRDDISRNMICMHELNKKYTKKKKTTTFENMKKLVDPHRNFGRICTVKEYEMGVAKLRKTEKTRDEMKMGPIRQVSVPGLLSCDSDVDFTTPDLPSDNDEEPVSVDELDSSPNSGESQGPRAVEMFTMIAPVIDKTPGSERRRLAMQRLAAAECAQL